LPGGVEIAPSVTDTTAQQIAVFLGQYFAAINEHDYSSYLALQSPALQQGLTPANFQDGYGSTADSGETLQDVSQCQRL
jgi:hypothetical protein